MFTLGKISVPFLCRNQITLRASAPFQSCPDAIRVRDLSPTCYGTCYGFINKRALFCLFNEPDEILTRRFIDCRWWENMAEPGAVACVQFADDAVPLFGHHYPSFANSFGPFCGPRFGRGRQASPPAARHRICLEHYLL